MGVILTKFSLGVGVPIVPTYFLYPQKRLFFFKEIIYLFDELVQRISSGFFFKVSTIAT